MQSARDWMERSTRSSLCSQTRLNMSASAPLLPPPPRCEKPTFHSNVSHVNHHSPPGPNLLSSSSAHPWFPPEAPPYPCPPVAKPGPTWNLHSQRTDICSYLS